MSSKFLIIIFFLVLQIYRSQEIKGRVINAETKLPVENAGVSLFNISDLLIKKTLSDSLGFFSFSVLPDKGYYIITDFIDFYSKRTDSISENNLIDLKPNVSNISEVIIEKKRPVSFHQSNTRVSVANNKDFRTSSNIIDVLGKLPGVTIGEEDVILLSGNVVPMVFINGKQAYMSAQQLRNYLKSLTPEMVISIEINNNPSAKYDAEFKGVIDIKLKKNDEEGWHKFYSGNVIVNRNAFFENNFNLSYAAKKITYQLGLGYDYGISGYRYNALQRLINTNVMRTDSKLRTLEKDYRLQFGINYRVDEANQVNLGFRNNYIDITRSRLGSLLTTNDNEDQIVFYTKSENPTDFLQENYAASLDYSFTKKHFSISLLGNYLSVKNQQADGFINKDFNTFQMLSYWKSDLSNKIDVFTYQVDAVQKINNISIEAGIKQSYSRTQNNIRYDTLSVSGIFVQDFLRSNMFSYKENISAGYLSYKQKLEKLTINAGIRTEYTYSISDAIAADSAISRKFLKWMPSLSLAYNFNNSEVNFSYSQRMTRPVFSQLNPFRFYFSPLNYWIGNPYLLPSITRQFKIGYSYKNWIINFVAGREYDAMVRYPRYNPDTSVMEFLGKNIPYRDFSNLNISFPLKLTRWWSFQTQLMGGYHYEYMPYFENVFAVKIFNYNIRVNQNFNLPKGFSLNVFANYESATGNSIYIIKPRYKVDVSLQKKWLSDKLNSKLGFENVFDSYNQQLIFRYKNIMDNQFTHWWDSQRLVLSLSYDFGSSGFENKDIKRSEEEVRAN